MITAAIALHRNDEYRIDAYGIALYNADGTPYAIASVHETKPIGVNAAIYAALAQIAEILREYDGKLFVTSREWIFKQPGRLRQALTNADVSYIYSRQAPHCDEALDLAEDAARRKTTIIEKF